MAGSLLFCGVAQGAVREGDGRIGGGETEVASLVEGVEEEGEMVGS